MGYNEVKRQPYQRLFSSNSPTNMVFTDKIFATDIANNVEFILNTNGEQLAEITIHLILAE